MDWSAHIRETVNHLAEMSSVEGFKHHAWFRANELAREYPDLYGNVPGLLTAEMHKRKTDAPSSQG